MRNSSRTRLMGAVAGISGLALALTGCSSGSDSASTSASGSAAAGDECAAYASYGDLKGKTITVYTSIVAPEDQMHIDSYKPFEKCTGATVKYEGSKEFEAQLKVRVKAGNAPDIAYIPQPGLLATLVKEDKAVKTAPEAVSKLVDDNFGPDWKKYGTVDGTFYAAPLGANVKSFVWYSPKMFADNGWKIPTTWDELKKLSDDIAAAGKMKPWCVGIGSGDATGWPTTDWTEDVMLRMNGTDVYDQWIEHTIPFNDPKVAAAVDEVGAFIKNDKYVNGGLGDVKSVASTQFQDAGLPILQGTCAMHRQASFYGSNFSNAGAKIGEDGDVWAFYLPSMNDKKPTLGGGEFVAAFSDRPEVQAFQAFLASKEWANEKAKVSKGWVTANKNADPSLFSGIDALSVKILQDPATQFRFDASDLMPAKVGAGTFWKGMTDWVLGKDTKSTLDFIEASWPTS